MTHSILALAAFAVFVVAAVAFALRRKRSATSNRPRVGPGHDNNVH